MTTLFAAYVYPNGTNSGVLSTPATPYPTQTGMMGDYLRSLWKPYPSQANDFAFQSVPAATVPGTVIYAGYGEGSPTNYWVVGTLS